VFAWHGVGDRRFDGDERMRPVRFVSTAADQRSRREFATKAILRQ